MASEFTIFPHLPSELRLKIWRSTFPGPRNVGVKIKFSRASFCCWVARTSTPPPPIALQVCHESREEALKHYVLSFGTTGDQPTIYFNYDIDTLCFGHGIDEPRQLPERQDEAGASDYLLSLWTGKAYNPHRRASPKATHARNIRYLMLDVDEQIYSRQAFCWEDVRHFEGLKELLIIAWDPDERADELMHYFRTAMDAVMEMNPEWVVPKIDVVSSSGTEWGNFHQGLDVSG